MTINEINEYIVWFAKNRKANKEIIEFELNKWMIFNTNLPKTVIDVLVNWAMNQ